ncbi:MAG: MarR family transcriptional regulator [Bacillota bacterium]|nr:MarR family transcriptional regulator [Bacillota bacterium]
MDGNKITGCCEESNGEMIQDKNCCNSELDTSQDDDCCVDEVGEMVQKLVRVFQLFERDQIKVHGFTSSQCYTLIEILKAGNLTMNELSDKMNLDTSTMTRVIDKLVRDGYIERDRDEADRRVVIVTLTDKGRESTEELSASVNEYYKKIISNIPLGKVDDILNSISVLLKAFEKANPNCC